MTPLRIGLVGLGNVGGAVWRQLRTQARLLERRSGRPIVIRRVSSRSPRRLEELGISKELWSPEWSSLTSDPQLDVIVEVIGGIEEAKKIVESALHNGKHVVTANKALLATHGQALFELASRQRRHVLFEASVAGGIPLIKALREGLVANRILSIHGILNGTCNYVLSRMKERAVEYHEALTEAKRLGFAEADERLDVEGHDAAHKAVILTALAYGFWPSLENVYREGIEAIQLEDLCYAERFGYELKLLAIIKGHPDGQVEVRVHPTLLPKRHILASVNGPYNAICVQGDVVGETLFYGPGAGGNPTASAILSDLAELARASSDEAYWERIWREDHGSVRLKPMEDILSRYYLRLTVEDRPGVLAQIASVFAHHHIGISAVIQPEGHGGARVPLLVLLHDAQERAFRSAKKVIEGLPVVEPPAISIRVEDISG
ncbi:homoserine dehydrogenase [Candidatus Methylacidithermus pantelleriae]|uniref:Homoserine dehydrogenase n=1 Tax=Candidatus Methylacidithermus pantelleriae TaxID=2744239 RepID=A0A8J2FV99_9BACT|nr:homoserine dehydrogenase [Candidatus Methylacidithermus pantelleriae]CAF0691861.1 Homoserine dehydrogenase [Candidatus Methylacidithermus pantelleriae]